MWPNNSLIYFGLVWIFLSFCHHPVAGLLHHSVTDPLATRLNEPPPPVPQHHPDIARPPRRRYIHQCDLLHSERFAAECDAVGIRVSTSKSEALVLSRSVRLTDGCSVGSNAGTVLDCCGDEEAELRGKALNLPVNLHSNPHLWS
ncbi:hypothetical protein N1851_003938 [Merluccius polli]|uniref:Uncharacterized protein n=1 Tax=Merluccius polli TaxID=89951 RepID=A0AA47N9A5_MERPO|nr:hypothetical protein N1851_003938 [Merluccius polli]